MNSDIIIYSAPNCSFCHIMIQYLKQLHSNKKITSYTVIDISQKPEEAEKLNIKTVPFLIIKSRVFIGQMTVNEIIHWYAKDESDQGNSDYFNWQLNKGELLATESTLKLNPELLEHAIQLLLDSGTQLSVKIGLMALIESYEGTPLLQAHLPIIKANIRHEDHRIRTDVTELLLLTQHTDAIEPLTKLCKDEHTEVSSAAKDALDELKEATTIKSNTLHSIIIKLYTLD